MENEQMKKRERSVAYPSFSLDESVKSSFELRKALGKGPYSRDEAARALGYRGISGISATKISTMVHFGLLNRNGNTYSQSELAERINHPLSDEDRNNAISEAIQAPRLYKDLLTQFAGQALPVQLGSILIRKGISAKIADSVAKNFQISLESSGFLKNGVVLPVPDFTNKMLEDEKNRETGIDVISANISSKQYIFSDSGDDWILTIKSARPLTVEIRKKLIDITELLEDGTGEKKSQT